MTETCVRCKEQDEDRRTLWMACFYDMDEMKLPFEKEVLSYPGVTGNINFYTLRVCKSCRSSWMKSIKEWFHNADVPRESCGSGIFVREFGDNIEITEQEWHERRKLKETA